MKICEIYNYLDSISPFNLQEKWDNSGVLLGDLGQDVQKIYLSIDVDGELLESMEENSLLITHHPIIFGALKQLQFHQYPAQFLRKMVQKNISNIAMHTNFDQTHLNEYVATKILGLKIIKKEGFVIYMEVDETFDAFASKVAKAFGLSHVKCVRAHENIKTVALTTGSGASLLRTIQADCFLTGDIKYHEAMEAKANNLSMIEIGHYESEQFFGEILKTYLENLGLAVIISQSKNPFIYS